MKRFVNLLLMQAIHDSAERMEFSLVENSVGREFAERMEFVPLVENSANREFRISYSGNGKSWNVTPPPSQLFGPAINVLCNYAGVNYYAKGTVSGRFETTSPASSWRFESHDLTKGIVLVRE